MKLIVVAMLLATSLVNAAEQATDEIRKQAYVARGAFDHQKAIPLLEELTRREPDRAAYFEILGSEYQEVGRLADALQAYRTACRLAPKDKYPRHRLLRLHREAGDWPAYEAVAKELVLIAPNEAASYHVLARAREEQGDVAGALEPCRKALEVEPTQREHNIPIGDVLVKLGRLEEAEAAYREALNSMDGDVALIQLGTLYLSQGRRADAERQYRELKKEWPDSAPALRRILDEDARSRKKKRSTKH